MRRKPVAKKPVQRRVVRRRPSRPIPWSPLLWTGFALSTIFGLLYSPITAPTKIRVEGAGVSDHGEIRAVLASLEGVPALQVNRPATEQRMSLRGQIVNASLSVNIFGRGLVKVKNDIPVARVQSKAPLAMNADGLVYTCDNIPENLPVVKLPIDAGLPSASVCGSWEMQSTGRLCEDISRYLGTDLPWTVSIDTRSYIQLRSGNTAIVKLGSTSNLDKKLKLLADALDGNQELLKKANEINIMSVNNPRYK